MVKNPTDNDVIKKALAAVAAIDEETDRKTKEQLGSLQSVLENIRARVTELLHQEEQIMRAIEKITGKSPEKKKRSAKGAMNEMRTDIGHWINKDRARKFSAADIKEEFPDIPGAVGTFLKPLLEAGEIRKEGEKVNTRYFAGMQ